MNINVDYWVGWHVATKPHCEFEVNNMLKLKEQLEEEEAQQLIQILNTFMESFEATMFVQTNIEGDIFDDRDLFQKRIDQFVLKKDEFISFQLHKGIKPNPISIFDKKLIWNEFDTKYKWTFIDKNEISPEYVNHPWSMHTNTDIRYLVSNIKSELSRGNRFLYTYGNHLFCAKEVHDGAEILYSSKEYLHDVENISRRILRKKIVNLVENSDLPSDRQPS